MPTDRNAFVASLIGCRGGLNAEVPLQPLNISSEDNRCRPPITNFVCSGSNFVESLSLTKLVIVLLGEVAISIMVTGSI